MNENLKQLAVVACDKEFVDVNQETLQKFAEALIEEVLRQLTSFPSKMSSQKLTRYNEGWRNGQLLAAEHIEESFGILRPPPEPSCTWCAYCGEGVTTFCRGGKSADCPKFK